MFSEADDSEWVLKGGTGMLARVPSTRATRDVDLYRCGFTLTRALDDLIRLAEIDLGDHFRFQYISHAKSIGNDAQPHTEGYQVRFEIFIGLSTKGSLHVDLAVGTGITGEVTTTEPANALDLPRLVRHRYRLYPVVDQIADKVCATMTEHNERMSSREKDLVDLVVIATTQNIDGTALQVAIATEVRRRQMEPFDRFACPQPGASATLGRASQFRTAPTTAQWTSRATLRSASSALRSLVKPTARRGPHETLSWI